MACPARTCCALVLIPLLWAPLPAGAFTDPPPSPIAAVAAVAADAAPSARGRISLDQAVAMVLGRYGGKVIRAETRSRNGRTVHSIKLLTDDGRVRTVQVDGDTGQVN